MTNLIDRSRLDFLVQGVIRFIQPDLAASWRERLERDRLVDHWIDAHGGAVDASALLARHADSAPETAEDRLLLRAAAVHMLRTNGETVDALQLTRCLALHDPELLPITVQSPFGFTIVKLFLVLSPHDPDEVAEIIRIHIWPDSARPLQSADTMIHKHSLHGRSWLLCGRLRNETYDVQPSATETPQSLYAIQHDAYRRSTIVNTHQHVRCKVSNSTWYTQGQTYEIPVSQYHVSQAPADTYTATLFYFGMHPGWEESLAIGPSSEESFETHCIQGHSPARSREILDEFHTRVLA